MLKYFRKCFICGMGGKLAPLEHLKQDTIYGSFGKHYTYHRRCLEQVLRDPEFYVNVRGISVVEKAVAVEQILRDKDWRQRRIEEENLRIINKAREFNHGDQHSPSPVSEKNNSSPVLEKEEKDLIKLSRYDIIKGVRR